MKSFVSVNAKYYKNSNASGELAHVNRLFHENVNSFPEHTKFNFGSDFDLYDKYKEVNLKHAKALNRNIRKDANTFLDCVVSFSLERWEALEKKHGSIKLQSSMKKMMHNFMIEMQQQHLLHPVGFKYHLDEGFYKQYEAYQNQQDRLKKGLLKQDELLMDKGELVRNIHAHVIFYNFDFKEKKAPLRKMNKKTFSSFQDIAGIAFAKSGYVRGILKDVTNKSHDERLNFVKNKIKAKQQELSEIGINVIDKQNELSDLTDEIKEQEALFKKLKKDIKRLYYLFKFNISKFARNLLKLDSDAIDENIEELQKIVTKTSEINNETAELMEKETNLYADKYKNLGLGKKIKNYK
jgi:hypothetical protein